MTDTTDQKTTLHSLEWVRGYQAAREQAAQQIECGCDPARRAKVVAVPPNSAARWNACGEANCCAIDAAAIRVMQPDQGGDPGRT